MVPQLIVEPTVSYSDTVTVWLCVSPAILIVVVFEVVATCGGPQAANVSTPFTRMRLEPSPSTWSAIDSLNGLLIDNTPPEKVQKAARAGIATTVVSTSVTPARKAPRLRFRLMISS